MPNIKGISSKDGNVIITKLTNAKYNLLRTDLAKLSVNINTGASIKDNAGFDVYTHLYIDETMKNPKRTVVMVCKKGYTPRKEWWINETIPIPTSIKEVINNG